MFYLYYTVCTCIILGCNEWKVLYELLKVMKRVTLLLHGIGLNKKGIGKLPRGWYVDNTGTTSFIELKGKLSKEASF